MSSCAEKKQDTLAKVDDEHNGNGEEANFYFNAGLTMENVQTGSGKEYLDRSLEMFHASKNINAMPLFASHLGAVARRHCGRNERLPFPQPLQHPIPGQIQAQPSEYSRVAKEKK